MGKINVNLVSFLKEEEQTEKMIDRLRNPDNRLFQDLFCYLATTIDPALVDSEFDKYDDFLDYMEFILDAYEIELKFKYSRKNFLTIGSNWKYGADVLDMLVTRINANRECRYRDSETIKKAYGGIEDAELVNNQYVQMYCDVFSKHENDPDNEYEDFKEKLNILNGQLEKKVRTNLNTYKKRVYDLEVQKRELLEGLLVPEAQKRELKDLNSNLDEVCRNKSEIISEISDYKMCNLKNEYKIKEAHDEIHTKSEDRDKLQHVIDNQLFNMEVYLEYTRNIDENTHLNDNYIDEVVYMKQKHESLSKQCVNIKSEYATLVASLRPNMEYAYFSTSLFSPNIDESNLERITMVETSSVIRNNWEQEHSMNYRNLYEFKNHYDGYINDLDNQKNVNNKLTSAQESSALQLAELKSKITEYDYYYKQDLQEKSNKLFEYKSKHQELNDRFTNGKERHEYLKRKYEYQNKKSEEHLQALMAEYVRYDEDVDRFMEEIDNEFTKATDSYLEQANRQNSSFARQQANFAESVNSLHLKETLLANYQLVKDHFGHNVNLEEIEALDEMVVNKESFDVSQKNSLIKDI